MGDIVIREAATDDAEKIIEYTRIIGGETDNLTYGAEGMPLTVDKERSFLQNISEAEHSVFYCALKDSVLVGTANLSGMPRRMSHRAELGISVLKAEWNELPSPTPRRKGFLLCRRAA